MCGECEKCGEHTLECKCVDDDNEYPSCKECNAEWTILPVENEWDIESSYLHHKPECEYAKKKLAKYANKVRPPNFVNEN